MKLENSKGLLYLSMMVTIIILFSVSLYNYLLVHIIIEFGITTLGVMIFSISINSKNFEEDNLLTLMGPGFLASALVGVLHTAAYKGMTIFSFVGSNAATQFWIILSYILAMTFLFSTFSYSKKIKYNSILMLSFFVTIILSSLVFSNNFPVCYIEGVGLTLFKKVSEYIIIAIYLFSLFKFSRNYNEKRIDKYTYNNLKLIIILLILGEASFTLYFDVYGFFNILGHFFKFFGFLVMYDSLFCDLLTTPYKKASYNNNHDFLTGLLNRKYFDELLTSIDIKENVPLGILLVDINTLKLINDAYGTKTGDEILINVARILYECINDKNYLARYDGDEFIVLFPNYIKNDIQNFINKYTEKIDNLKINEIKIKVSSGFFIKEKEEENIEDILVKAENDMNKNKLAYRIGIRANAVNAILQTLYEKNIKEETHSKRVSKICYMFGEKLDLSDREKNMLKMMGLVHDVGKIALDEEILNKNGELTKEEYEEIKKHPETGFRILSSSNDMSDIAEFVLAHHERWDGKGYPRGLRSDNIPYLSRIISIVDSYDAMTSERSYKDILNKDEVIIELKKGSSKQFDPELIPIFLVFLEENVDL